MPFIPCTYPLYRLLYHFFKWVDKYFHFCLWNPYKMIIDIVLAVSPLAHFSNLEHCFFCKFKMLFAVDILSIFAKLVYYTPVCVCSHVLPPASVFDRRPLAR